MDVKFVMSYSKNLLNQYYYFFFSLLVINISISSQSFLSFKYPYAITIKDRNIFVIHQDGVTICDPKLKTIVRKEIIFEDSEKINSDGSLSKVTSLYENGYIIILINDYIYIFDEEGNLKFKSSSSIHSGSIYGDYYTLVNIGLISNCLYYIIGFVYNQRLYFYGYKYDISSNTNSNFANLEGCNHQYSSSSFYIKNKGLSCQYVTKTSLGQRLLCVYLIYGTKSKISFDYFKVTTSAITRVSSSYSQYLAFSDYDVTCFKTALSSDKTQILLVTYNSDGIGTFAIFDVNKSYSKLENKYIPSHYYRMFYHNLKVTYFQETNEYLMTGLLTSNGQNDLFLVEFFDGQLSNNNYAYKYERSCEIKAYSILYLEHKSAYYIMSDIICSGIDYPLQILIGEEPTEIAEETQAPTAQYIASTTHYIVPTTQYINPTTQYIIPTTQYINPTTQYISPTTQYVSPTTQYISPSTQYISPTTQLNENTPTEYNYITNTQYIELYETQKSDKIINSCQNLEKCDLCDENSVIQNLCITCNNIKGYYYLNENSLNEQEQGNRYIDCVNNETKPNNFYFNEENEDYRPCYETCETCEIGGDYDNNNCKTCRKSYIFKPDITSTTNCVIKCQFYYFYTISEQYKCSENFYCPSNNILLIPEKGKCINDCKKDDIYKYQYDTKCLNECPNNTEKDNNNYICKDKNTNDYKLTETKHIFFNENITNNEINNFVKYYANNFNYTDKHISSLESNNVSIIFFKYNNSDIISNLSIGIPQINLDDCINEIKRILLINENLIIAIESKQSANLEDRVIYFSVYNPITKEKIIYDEICENIPVTLVEDLIGKVKDLNSVIFLTNQGINVADINSDFYTDICFHYKSPIDGKDIPLKERIKLFYPNISFCREGCFFKGINTTLNKSICECKLNDLIENDLIKGNKFLESSIENIKTLVQKTNIEILKCYKDLFKREFYISNHGSFIIFGLCIIQLILTIIYYKKYIFAMRKYLFNITYNYLMLLASKGIDINIDKLLLKHKNNLLKYTKTLNKNNKEKYGGKSNFQIDKSNPRKSIQNRFIKSKRNTISFKHNKSSFDNLLTPKLKEEKKDNINQKKSSIIFKDKQLDSFLKINSKNKNNLDISLMIVDKFDIDMEEYIETDPNDMDYDSVIKRDKRKFCSFFSDKLNEDLFFLNIFCLCEPLNPKPIKLLLFIMNIDLNFFVNGLFFTEEHLDELYTLKNDSFLNIIDRFTDRIIYITLIEIIIDYISDFFFFKERTIKKILKREKENILFLKYEMAQIAKNIKNRYNLFIFICFLVSIFVWYYAFCFNNIYPSMKIEWLITSVIIIFFMQVFEFLKLLLQTCVRFISIKCKSEKLFKLSNFLS